MTATRLPLDDLIAWIGGRPVELGPSSGGPVVVVDLDEHDGSPVPDVHAGLPIVVVGVSVAVSPERHSAAAACDVVLQGDGDALAGIVSSVERWPIASVALATLLRGSEQRSIDDGLLAESAVYSALQAGPEFAAWRASRATRQRTQGFDPVLVARHGGDLEVTLNRAEVRNALNAAMRDRLVEAFVLPAIDSSITEVHLRGAGEAFCSGGDLDEFGTFSDPASAHLVRLEHSVGRSIAAVAHRVTAHLHGACVGSGIELPAFAGRVMATGSTTISLPEVSLGLVPGAGGTVSLPSRIGRHRTAQLALSGESIDAQTAVSWGLVDGLE